MIRVGSLDSKNIKRNAVNYQARIENSLNNKPDKYNISQLIYDKLTILQQKSHILNISNKDKKMQ